MSDYDVAVVGLGAMGSATAHRLAQRGARVIGVERFSPAHAFGSSHGESRIIRQAYFEDPAYVPLVRRAYDLWRSLEAETGRRLLTLTGGLMLGPAGSRTVAGSRRSAEQWGLPHEVLTATDVRERFPQFAVGDGDIALYEPVAGVLDPEESVRAQLEAAASRGAELRFGEPVTGWSVASSGVEVSTAQGTYRAARLVLCPGAWAPRMLGLGPVFRVERQVMHWFARDDGTVPFDVGRCPVFVWEDASGEQIYGFPSRGGTTEVKAAFFRRREVCDPDDVDRTVRPAEIDEISRYLATRIPELNRHLRGVTCLYTLTDDLHFAIGPHPRWPEVLVAAGFSGHGFKFAPVVGELLADLVLTGSTEHELALFDPARLTRKQPDPPPRR